MKNFLAILVAGNVFSTALAITNCVCNNRTVAATTSPVCASDGKTYRNAQLVNCMNTCYQTNLRIVSNGACVATTRATVAITPTRVPVYPAVTLAPILKPNTPGRCYYSSRGAYSPVCGSDGRTYASPELLACYNRCYNTKLSVIRLGWCPKNLCICTNTNYYSPVCGSDGRTYKNVKIVKCLNVCRKMNIVIVKYQPC